ncbi:hypothetical protein F4X88_14375 [Candidatus Poribacteria bacterium]|nr:hypothetical protein [Candidatus Poribacteria bacterium]MYA57476.1 hypothetical protein [Candidatus Poribacteria bacterium]
MAFEVQEQGRDGKSLRPVLCASFYLQRVQSGEMEAFSALVQKSASRLSLTLPPWTAHHNDCPTAVMS